MAAELTDKLANPFLEEVDKMKSLFVKQFVDEDLGNSSYLIASEETGIAAVIDPQRDVDKYLRTAEGLGLKLAYALDTHLHADFVSGAHELAHQLGIQHEHPHFQIGASALAEAEFEHISLNEGDLLSLGDLSIGVIATPGHTPEHVAFGVYDGKSETPETLFSGGSLIVGGTGRPDLLGHEHTIPLAHSLYNTIHKKIALLPDEVVVYPTHGAGSFCNTSSSGERFTTIGQERKSNPFLQISGEEEFVRRATTGLSSYPTYYRSMRTVNKKGGRVLGGVPTLKGLSPEEVHQQIKSGTVILDIRPTPKYLQGHIEDSYGIPLVTPLITWAGWVIPFGTPIVLVADTPAELEDATRQLIRIGYDDLRGYLDDGVKAWQRSGRSLAATKSIDAARLKEWLSLKDAPAVLDVRYNKEWHAGHIRAAKHVEAGSLPEVARSLLQEDRPLVVHCQRGNRSTVALSILEQKGYQNLFALEDGFQSWVQCGFEVVTHGH
jgi:hydroxyacylglutathione hydrolase